MTVRVEDPVLSDQLEHWVDAGLLSREQAELIAAHERERATVVPARGESLAAEALSYVGAVLVTVAAVVLSARYWDDLALAARVALLGGAAAVLLTSGLVAGRRGGGPARRIRAGSWLLATGTFAGLVAVVAADGFSLDEAALALAFTSGTLPLAFALWWVERSTVQHAALFVVALGTVGAAAMQVTDETAAAGVATWVASAVWAVAAERGALEPGRTGRVVAAVGLLYAAVMLASSGRGWQVLAVATALLVLVEGVQLRDLVLLALGAVGTLVLLPGTVHAFWPNDVAPPLALLVAGVLVLAAGVRGWASRER